MFGMIRLPEVRHLKYTYTVHWKFGDSPSTDSDMRSVSSSTTEYICLPTCLSVCLWACMFVYQKGILPLARGLYKLRQCLGLNHNFFRDVPKSKQSKENMLWWLWTTLVSQVVSASVQCSRGLSLSKKTYCMSVCVPQAYYPLCLKLDL